MSRDPGFKFRKFLFFSISNFRKSYQIWGNWLNNKKVTGKKQMGGDGKDPPWFRRKMNLKTET